MIPTYYSDYLSFLRFCINADAEVPDCVRTINWQGLLTFANEQTVTGLCCHGIMKLNAMSENGRSVEDIFGSNKPTDDDLLMWLKKTARIPKKNESVDRTLAMFCKFMKKRNVSFVVFKGQTLSRCYDHPEVRICGDIDFYVAEAQREEVREMLKRIVTFSDTPSLQHWEFKADGVPYEMHFHTTVFSVPKHQEYWDGIVEEELKKNLACRGNGRPYNNFVTILGEDVPTFSPEVNAVYLFLHLHYHFMKEGVGMRQFVDWMVFFQAFAGKIDRNRVEEILSNLQYEKAFRVFGVVLVDTLGLKADLFPMQINEQDRKWVPAIMKIVLRGGNFGRHGRLTNKKGLLHSLETGLRSVSHVFRFYSLAPSENRRFLKEIIKLSIKKNL